MINISSTVDVALVLGIVSLLTIVGRFIYRLSRFIDHLSCMLNAWDGNNEKPGVLDRLNDIEKKLDDVHCYVKTHRNKSSVNM
jgi:hypothetical protein